MQHRCIVVNHVISILSFIILIIRKIGKSKTYVPELEKVKTRSNLLDLLISLDWLPKWSWKIMFGILLAGMWGKGFREGGNKGFVLGGALQMLAPRHPTFNCSPTIPHSSNITSLSLFHVNLTAFYPLSKKHPSCICHLLKGPTQKLHFRVCLISTNL